MSITSLISGIDAEISRLQEARALLAGTSSPIAKKRGRLARAVKVVKAAAKPAKVVKAAAKPAKAAKKAKHTLSAEGRARISAAAKARWAAKKKAAKK
jgi:hypothetical protein